MKSKIELKLCNDEETKKKKPRMIEQKLLIEVDLRATTIYINKYTYIFYDKSLFLHYSYTSKNKLNHFQIIFVQA